AANSLAAGDGELNRSPPDAYADPGSGPDPDSEELAPVVAWAFSHGSGKAKSPEGVRTGAPEEIQITTRSRSPPDAEPPRLDPRWRHQHGANGAILDQDGEEIGRAHV